MTFPLPVDDSEEEMTRWFAIRIRFNPVIVIPWWLIILTFLTLLLRESFAAAKTRHSSEQVLSYALVSGIAMGTLYGMLRFALYIKDLWALFSALGDKPTDSTTTKNSISSIGMTIQHFLLTMAKRYVLLFVSKDRRGLNVFTHSTEIV